MTVYELNRDQLEELKQRYLTEKYDELGLSPSYQALAEADSLITDKEIYDAYADTTFSMDDFFCSAGEIEYDMFNFEAKGNSTPLRLVHDLREIAEAINAGYVSGTARYGTNWNML